MIKESKLQEVLDIGFLIIGGSFQYKDNFKDIDIFLIVEDIDFERLFLSPDKWLEERETGDWTAGMFKFREYSLQMKEIIKRRLQSRMLIDFWIVPKKYSDKELINR